MFADSSENRFVDPNLSLDVYANKPWALSPTLATFNFLSLSRDKPDYAHSVEESSLARLKEMYDASKPSKGADGEDEESDEDDEDDDCERCFLPVPISFGSTHK